MFHLCVFKGGKTHHRLENNLLRTWERVWFLVRSCTTSVQLWGLPGQPPSGSFHLYPPDMLVPVSLQKLWKTGHNKDHTRTDSIFRSYLKTGVPLTSQLTFTFLFLFWYLLQPPQQTPQICDAIHEGNLLILIWSGLLQDLPYIHLWGVILLLWLPGPR